MSLVERLDELPIRKLVVFYFIWEAQVFSLRRSIVRLLSSNSSHAHHHKSRREKWFLKRKKRNWRKKQIMGPFLFSFTWFIFSLSLILFLFSPFLWSPHGLVAMKNVLSHSHRLLSTHTPDDECMPEYTARWISGLHFRNNGAGKKRGIYTDYHSALLSFLDNDNETRNQMSEKRKQKNRNRKWIYT